MSPSKRGGRPKIAWDGPRKRKLVRLYLMTSLRIEEIQQALKSDKFNPGKRNVQEQLSELLPDVQNNWRQYRPRATDEGINRLAQMKSCKEYLKGRLVRRKTGVEVAGTKTPEASGLDILEAFYDPLHHYVDEPNAKDPSCILPELSQWYSNVPLSSSAGTLAEDYEDRMPSDKEVYLPDDVNFERVTDVVDCNPSRHSPVRINLLGTNPIDDPTAVPIEDFTEESSKPDKNPGMTRSSTRGSDTGGASIKSISTRISSQLSRSLRHANSVLSATNSWTSGLAYTSSISTGRFSSTKGRSLVGHEFVNWDKLEDVSATSNGIFHCPEISLEWRPCCDYFVQMPALGLECATCGTKEVHYLAREVELNNISSLDGDRFGNTTLHHAAAAGNLLGIIRFLKTFGPIPNTNPFSRNTSGETFLHVIRFNHRFSHFANFESFLEILRCTRSLGFSFSTRDDRGMTVTQAFLVYAGDFKFDKELLREAQRILEPKVPGNTRGTSSEQMSAARDIIKSIDPVSETALLRALKRWPETSQSLVKLRRSYKENDIHIRDTRGHTPLAIAASLGIWAEVLFLLEQGANPNSRSYRGTSVIAYATTHLARALNDGNVEIYAKILSCVVLLADHGAKPVATAYDEYCIPPPPPKPKRKSIRDAILKPLLSTSSKTKSESPTTPLKQRQLSSLDVLREEPYPNELRIWLSGSSPPLQSDVDKLPKSFAKPPAKEDAICIADFSHEVSANHGELSNTTTEAHHQTLRFIFNISNAPDAGSRCLEEGSNGFLQRNITPLVSPENDAPEVNYSQSLNFSNARPVFENHVATQELVGEIPTSELEGDDLCGDSEMVAHYDAFTGSSVKLPPAEVGSEGNWHTSCYQVAVELQAREQNHDIIEPWPWFQLELTEEPQELSLYDLHFGPQNDSQSVSNAATRVNTDNTATSLSRKRGRFADLFPDKKLETDFSPLMAFEPLSRSSSCVSSIFASQDRMPSTQDVLCKTGSILNGYSDCQLGYRQPSKRQRRDLGALPSYETKKSTLRTHESMAATCGQSDSAEKTMSTYGAPLMPEKSTESALTYMGQASRKEELPHVEVCNYFLNSEPHLPTGLCERHNHTSFPLFELSKDPRLIASQFVEWNRSFDAMSPSLVNISTNPSKHPISQNASNGVTKGSVNTELSSRVIRIDFEGIPAPVPDPPPDLSGPPSRDLSPDIYRLPDLCWVPEIKRPPDIEQPPSDIHVPERMPLRRPPPWPEITSTFRPIEENIYDADA
ncbi:hypothetical protein EG329_002929 [Mollisiaceae sp. DMI_Dod_QoI]|nr:hypothetical protein EG329_002929 [Helotiales sp. DMI_Dod_QoI]